MDTNIYVHVTMYYDECERECGDGYYPLMEREKVVDIQVQETFYLDDPGCWIQQTFYDLHHSIADRIFTRKNPGLEEYAAIKGLDGDCGIKLLTILNNKIYDILGIKGDKIFNNRGKQLYPINL